MTLWLVRAGRYGEREQLALEKNIAVIGWDDVPDLSQVKTREQLMQLLEEIYPDEKKKTLINWGSQIWPFINTIQIGDLVALPFKNRSVILIGEVTGNYQHRPDLPSDARHTRPVKWIGEFPRTGFDQDILYSLGAFMTVCRIQRNNAEERVKAIITGKPVLIRPGSEAPEDANEDIVPPDLEQYSRDQIRDFISTMSH